MRFIVHEQPFENLIAAGELHYEQDGLATGTIEKWRITAVTTPYQFLRVDLDARAAPSGHSYLYHAVLGANGRFERLKFRFWGDVDDRHLHITGDIVFEPDTITAYRTINGTSYEQVLSVPASYRFWFPASMGLGYLGADDETAVGMKPITGQQAASGDPVAFSLFMTNMAVSRREDGAVCYHWEDQKRTVWHNAAGQIVKMVRGDGLTAVTTRMMTYK